jgi:hypothetical protein
VQRTAVPGARLVRLAPALDDSQRPVPLLVHAVLVISVALLPPNCPLQGWSGVAGLEPVA